MERVEEIEAAIDELSPEEYRRIVQWLRLCEDKRWDEQMDRDSSEIGHRDMGLDRRPFRV